MTVTTRPSQGSGYFTRIAVRAVIFVGILAMIAGVLVPGNAPVRAAQGTVTIEGPVQAIAGDNWTVGGIAVKVTVSTSRTGNPVVGSTVRVVAAPGSDGKLVAQSIIVIIIIGTPPATSPATAAPTAAPTAPATRPGVTIIIEGPVEEVDVSINVVVVYGFRVRMRDDDPVKKKIKVGDWVRVKGHFDRDEVARVIIVAVVMIIIIDAPSTTIIIVPSGGGRGHGDDDDD